MEMDFSARDKPSSTYFTHLSPFEPLSIPGGVPTAVRLGILTKSLADDFQVISTRILAAGKKSPVEKFSGQCMPYRSSGFTPQVMLQDKLLEYEASLTVSDHN